MTPRETFLAIDAAVWQDERRQRQDTALAWRTAALMRAKRLPALKSLLISSTPAKPLRGKELTKRRNEFHEMTADLDLKALAKKHAKKKVTDDPTG